MKKILSMFLALVLMLSMATVAFAANVKIALDEPKAVSLKDGDIATYAFTAPASGVYQFTIKANEFCSVTVYATYNTPGNAIAKAGMFYVDDEVADDYGILSEESSTGYFCLKKGKTIKLVVMEDSADYFTEEEMKEFGVKSAIKPTLTVEKANLVNTRLGGVYTSKIPDKYYIFRPEKSGYYNFRSFANNGCDPAIDVIGVDGLVDGGDDIGYEDDYNFDLTVYLKKGQTYLLNVYDVTTAMFGDMGEEIYFKFKITDGSEIEPEYILPMEDDIIMTKGDFYDIPLLAVPAGAINVDFTEATVTSSKARVADGSILYDEESEIYMLEVESYRPGKTTITVELPNGASCEIKVAVKSNFAIMLQNFFDMLFGFFTPEPVEGYDVEF